MSLVAVIGLAHWFFGNLYEEIVLAPNNLVHSYEQLLRWQNYYLVTNQIYYYVPFTQIAVLIVWFLYFKNTDTDRGTNLRKASIYGLLALALTAVIITQLNLKLFFGDLNLYRDQVHQMSVYWFIGNGLRVMLVGMALRYAFRVYLSYVKSAG